jgi:hypothetical protein
MCRSDAGDCNLVLGIAIWHLSWVEYGKCNHHYPPNGDGYLLWFWVHRDHIYAYSSIFGNPEFLQALRRSIICPSCCTSFWTPYLHNSPGYEGNCIFSSLIALLKVWAIIGSYPRSLYLCNRWSDRQCEPGDISFSSEGPVNLFCQRIFFNRNPYS